MSLESIASLVFVTGLVWLCWALRRQNRKAWQEFERMRAEADRKKGQTP